MTKLITLSVLLASTLAFAQSGDAKAKAQAAFERGQKLYEAKQYDDAINQFLVAYSLDPNPIYHFNTAQSYRLMGDCSNAKVFYEKFRDEAAKDLSAQDLDKIKKYISGEGCTPRDQSTPPNPNPPNPNPNPNPPNPNPPNPNPPNPNPVQPNPEPAQPTASSPSHIPEIGLGIAGVAAIVVGGIFTSKVAQDGKDRDAILTEAMVMDMCDLKTNTCPSSVSASTLQMYNDRLKVVNDHGSQQQTIAAVAYVAGGLAIAGAVTLFVLHRSHHDTSEKMVLVAPAPGGAQVTAGWRF